VSLLVRDLLCLYWLACSDLVEGIVWEDGLSLGRKPKIIDRATPTLVHCFLSGDIAFEEPPL
jgi:hypothetical protein